MRHTLFASFPKKTYFCSKIRNVTNEKDEFEYRCVG